MPPLAEFQTLKQPFQECRNALKNLQSTTSDVSQHAQVVSLLQLEMSTFARKINLLIQTMQHSRGSNSPAPASVTSSSPVKRASSPVKPYLASPVGFSSPLAPKPKLRDSKPPLQSSAVTAQKDARDVIPLQSLGKSSDEQRRALDQLARQEMRAESQRRRAAHAAAKTEAVTRAVTPPARSPTPRAASLARASSPQEHAQSKPKRPSSAASTRRSATVAELTKRFDQKVSTKPGTPNAAAGARDMHARSAASRQQRDMSPHIGRPQSPPRASEKSPSASPARTSPENFKKSQIERRSARPQKTVAEMKSEMAAVRSKLQNHVSQHVVVC